MDNIRFFIALPIDFIPDQLYAIEVIDMSKKNDLLTRWFFHILHLLFYQRLVFFLLFGR